MSSEFTVHRLNDYGLAACDAIAAAFERLLQDIQARLPAGRVRALVITKLQEACFFAQHAVALIPENRIPNIACPAFVEDQ